MRILIGYDGSPAAKAALEELRNAGLPEKAEAYVLSVYPPILPLESLAPDGNVPSGYALAYRDAVANQKAALARSLADAQSAARKVRARFPGWKISSGASVDVPAHAILDKAESWKADLIVLGSRGWSEFGKLLLGSVADKVLNHASCPVRLSRPREGARRGPPSLLLAYDGSRHAQAMLAEVSRRAWPKGTRATLLAVSEFQLRMGDLSIAVSEALGYGRGKGPWPEMERKLMKAAGNLAAAGVEAKTAIMIGEPRRSLLDQAAKLKVDAIYMGSHGHTGLRRLMLGSVSAAVAAHAPCSVEVIHMPKAKRK